MRSVILDMDPGVDDALAIVFAANSPELAVVGISTVSGNVPVNAGTVNALKILELIGRTDIPVYAGAERPLCRTTVHALEIHGTDGLGEARLPLPQTAAAGEAVPFLVNVLAVSDGDLTLIATGPLTNLALAEISHPGILKRAGEVVIMGGALDVPGNSAPRSEFNFYADPHAARKVVTESGANLTLVPLDATRQVFLSGERIQRELNASPTATAAFCAAAVRTPIAALKRLIGLDGICLHDPLAVGVAIDASLCRIETRRIDIETEGMLTAGMVVQDDRGLLDGRASGVEVNCAVSVEIESFMRMFLERVSG